MILPLILSTMTLGSSLVDSGESGLQSESDSSLVSSSLSDPLSFSLVSVASSENKTLCH